MDQCQHKSVYDLAALGLAVSINSVHNIDIFGLNAVTVISVMPAPGHCPVVYHLIATVVKVMRLCMFICVHVCVYVIPQHDMDDEYFLTGYHCRDESYYRIRSN